MKKVSIVTATYNSSEFIADCISSIHEQTYANIEHIIIDGASKDNTVEIIKGMPNRVEKLISEPDKGIYNAMNKGLKLATGDIIGILNSDDFYNSNDVIAKVVAAMEKDGTDTLHGNLYYVAQENTDIVKRKWVTGEYNPKKGISKWLASSAP
ncbi:glycosyltransferase family 2 protein [Maribacter halichondriae]|uniref:glycosyltransferase family 2 protein n=1 Tax=Maribacter halichondriae TaxID=2980554 RepID=UPI0023582B01|nr:glycosyltransferase family 2 protein [Maribacter sp. Hal144]